MSFHSTRLFWLLPLLSATLVFASAQLQSATLSAPPANDLAPQHYLPAVVVDVSATPLPAGTATPTATAITTSTPATSPTTTTGPADPSRAVLQGMVSYLPRFREASGDRPVRYLVVLDVSSSMSWNIVGQGTVNGQTVSCVDGSVRCGGGAASAWAVESERRIAIVKQALKTFVDDLARQSGTRPYDAMRLVTFAGSLGDYVNDDGIVGDDAAAVTNLTRVYPSAWSNNPAVLKAAIDQAGDIGLGPYITDGARPSAVGLARATQALEAAPQQAPNGHDYRDVVIMITDGVPDVLRNGLRNNAGPCDAQTVACQSGLVPGTDPPLPGPIEAMRGVAAQLVSEQLVPNGGASYAVMVGPGDTNGLEDVATNGLPVRVLSAEQLRQFLQDLQVDTVYSACVAGAGPPTNVMNAADVPIGTPPDGFAGLSETIVGYVNLTVQGTGQHYLAPIAADPVTRQLSYRLEDLAPGSYTMQAWVGYRAPQDGIARQYSVFVQSGTPATQQAVTIAAGDTTLSLPVTLDLNGTVCAAEP
jgi:cytochrome c556